MVKAASKDAIEERIVKLKDVDGKTWQEISDAVGKPLGKCMFLYEKATVTPKNKITGKDEDTLKKNIADARGSGMSWGVISARSGKSEGYCKSAFQEITGESAKGNRIGKGGRYPDGTEGSNKPSGAVKKATGAKKAAGAVKKATAKKVAKKAGGNKAEAVKKAAKKAVKATASA